MNRILHRTIKIALGIISIPVLYILIALITTWVPVSSYQKEKKSSFIFISTNGVHLDFIFPKENIAPDLLKDLKNIEDSEFVSFGWGDENFYINTPTWEDLTIKSAVSAMLLESATLVHLTKHRSIQKNWVKVPVSSKQLEKLNEYIRKSFRLEANGNKQILLNKGYTKNDDFYKATGSYSCLNTCNSWVNTGLKKCDLKACLWTPFDFGVLWKYESN